MKFRTFPILTMIVLLSSATHACLAADLNTPDSRNKKGETETSLNLSPSEATAIGNKVWRNECGGRIDGLTSWNAGEDFPSLGIGHFIWYPKNAHDNFEESFPSLIDFLQNNGVQLPSWLTPDMRCPWNSRDEFLRNVNGTKLTELRTMLKNTVPLQTKFIVARLNAALPKVLECAPESERASIRSRFYRVMNSGSAGAFAVIDYVNFKGEGVNPGERYNGKGWGLLQVLEGMSDRGVPLQAFAKSAADVLTLRVQNAPPERHEERWLLGWKKRVSSYCLGTTGSSISAVK